MLEDALSTVRDEILRYKTKVARGQPLNAMEAKVMQGYIKSLVELSKEDRERQKDADLSDLSTEDLLKLLGGQNKLVSGKGPASDD
jgi:hypothetical protein